MAKLLVIIICVCNVCVHMAWAQMARKDLWSQHKLSENNIHGVELNRQNQLNSAYKSSNLEYGNRVDPVHHRISESNIKSGLGNEVNNGKHEAHRIKRHADHSHGVDAHGQHPIEMSSVTDQFIEKLFNKFTDSDQGTMNLIEFDKMVKQLGLARLIRDNQIDNADENDNTGDSQSNATVSS